MATFRNLPSKPSHFPTPIPNRSRRPSLHFPPSFPLFSTTRHFGRLSSVSTPASASASASTSASHLKHNWLDSLSCPPSDVIAVDGHGASAEWVLGIDPDVSGALAVLKFDAACFSAQVFDTPHLPVLVGKRVRNRLDARSIVQLLRSLGIPHGSVAYIEQSTPFPKDGKQGWWSGGFGYGLWIGILVASGFSVVPVSSMLWKNQFELSGSSSSKDESRKAASTLFPSLSSLLKRKKDHGRAEALLIAAYGKDLQIPSELPVDSDAAEDKMLVSARSGY